MVRIDDLVTALGAQVREERELTEVDPETLAEAHLRGEMLASASLFSPEPLPGEEGWRPGASALIAVEGLVGAPKPWEVALRWVDQALAVIHHSGAWLEAQPLAVRGAAAAAEALPTEARTAATSHTFRQQLPPYEATLGLEAEAEGNFAISLSLSDDEASEPRMRVILWEGERRRAVKSGVGHVYHTGLPAGDYRMEVVADGEEAGSIEIRVHGGEVA